MSTRALRGLALFACTALAAFPGTLRAQTAGDYPEQPDGDTQEVGGEDDYADTDPSALTDFHATLDSHGTWVDDPTYGAVWVPSEHEVGSDFAPYVSGGSWTYDEDYVWASDYEWGWAPFHYGRWAWMGGRWGWIPGRVYSGGWVSWRVGPQGYGYCGWGPMAPVFGWRAGVAFTFGAEVVARPSPVVFVARESLFAPRVATRLVVGARMAAIAGETHPFGVEARSFAHPVARGPAPASLGIQASAVVRADPHNPNLARARAFARPSTAQALGARAPSRHRVRTRSASGGESSPAREAPERSERTERGGPEEERRSGGGEQRSERPPPSAPPPPRPSGHGGGGHRR